LKICTYGLSDGLGDTAMCSEEREREREIEGEREGERESVHLCLCV